MPLVSIGQVSFSQISGQISGSQIPDGLLTLAKLSDGVKTLIFSM